MGATAEEHPRKPYHHNNTTNRSRFATFLLLLFLTNFLTIYIFYTPNLSLTSRLPPLLDAITSDSSTHHRQHHQLLQQLNATQTLLSHLQHQLHSANSLLDALLLQRQNPNSDPFHRNVLSMSQELNLAAGPHNLPLGFSPRSGSHEVHPSVGAACLLFQDDINKYMNYDVGGECPVDDALSQKLMLKGCDPLPRRRCRPKSPVGYVDPTPFPSSLWSIPPDTSIVWDAYPYCKSYNCLLQRKNNSKQYFDCDDCFDLKGREKTRWLFNNGLYYSIDQVLRTKPPGTIRIGLDIGGGTGTFAARMRERNVTIITTTMNLDGPFNSFIASRGLIALHVTVSQRLPFFENTLDIVHSMHVLSNWIPDGMLEFTLYDIYRVLRPGGLFWLDHFFCFGSQLNSTYVPMFNGIGFNKLRWNAGPKLDKGVHKNEWYLSALLEKPMT